METAPPESHRGGMDVVRRSSVGGTRADDVSLDARLRRVPEPKFGGCLARLLWFHAFDRSSIQSVLGALRTSVEFNPLDTCTTRVNEKALGIPKPCVYTYLGRTFETFGSRAVALPMGSFDGLVSPFDTGGLVKNISPISAWPAERRQQYLQAYSFEMPRMPELLEVYPSSQPDAVAKYLRGEQPNENGPHVPFPPEQGDLLADIWLMNEDPRAWLWESRTPDSVPTGSRMTAWTCKSEEYGEILLHLESLSDDNPPTEWLEFILSRYIAGGLGRFVEQLRAEQEVA